MEEVGDEFGAPVTSDMCGNSMLKTWMMNSRVSLGASISYTVGMNMPCFIRQSTMTRIVVCLSDSGRCSMKSMEMEFQGVDWFFPVACSV